MSSDPFATAFVVARIIGILIALTIGIALYYDAESRGTSGCVWGVCGFLFACPTLIIYLFVRGNLGKKPVSTVGGYDSSYNSGTWKGPSAPKTSRKTNELRRPNLLRSRA